MSLQQALGHVRVPDRDGRREQLGSGRCPQQPPCQFGGAPARRPQRQHQNRLHDDPAVDDSRDRGQQRVLRNGPGRRITQPERRIGEIGPRRTHRIPQQQVSGPEQRADHDQRQHQAVADRHEPPPPPATRPTTLDHAQPPYVPRSPCICRPDPRCPRRDIDGGASRSAHGQRFELIHAGDGAADRANPRGVLPGDWCVRRFCRALCRGGGADGSMTGCLPLVACLSSPI